MPTFTPTVPVAIPTPTNVPKYVTSLSSKDITSDITLSYMDAYHTDTLATVPSSPDQSPRHNPPRNQQPLVSYRFCITTSYSPMFASSHATIIFFLSKWQLSRMAKGNERKTASF